MRSVTKIIINKPLEYVIKKLDSTANMKHWQDGLVASEHISGTPGEFGSKMKLIYNFGKRNMELTETITKRNFPFEFHATYKTKGIHNIQQNYFKITANGKTEWISQNDFKPTNFTMNTMLFLMPRTFKKQSQKHMTNFKKFVEHGTSVAHA